MTGTFNATIPRPVVAFVGSSLSDEQPVPLVFLRESPYDTDAMPDRGGGTTMAADNQALGSDWRGWGVRMGVVSVMAATGMVLAGQAAQATTTVTESPGTQANGDGEGLPLNMLRVPDGNSGATCISIDVLGTGATISDRALKRDITLVQWSR